MGFLDHLSPSPVPDLSNDAILLRMPRHGDFEGWRDLRQASSEFLRPWEPVWADDELSRAAYRARLKRYRREAQDKTSFTFFLFDADGETLYGGTTVGHIRRGVAQSCMLGYWMGERFAGAGLMSQAVELLKLFAFDVEGLHRMEAACLPTNRRSIRLLEKCGFSQEGYLKGYLKIAGSWEDHLLYGLLAEDWSRSGARATYGRPGPTAGGRDA